MTTDFNQLLEQFRTQGANDPRFAKIQQFMQSAQGQNLAQTISPQMASQIAQAAQAAQRGDQQSAKHVVQDIMRTPEGAALAAQLRSMLGK